MREVSRTNNNFSATRNDGKQKQNPSSSGVVLQIQARVDVEIVPSAAQVTLVKYGALSCIGLRVWNMDLDKRTRKIDTLNKTEDASTNCTNKKKIQKKDGKQHENQKSDIEKEKKAKRTPKAKHKKEAALTPIATKIATSPLQKTQTKRLEEGCQDSVFDRNAQKNEMAIGNENSIATKRTMGKESC